VDVLILAALSINNYLEYERCVPLVECPCLAFALSISYFSGQISIISLVAGAFLRPMWAWRGSAESWPRTVISYWRVADMKFISLIVQSLSNSRYRTELEHRCGGMPEM